MGMLLFIFVMQGGLYLILILISHLVRSTQSFVEFDECDNFFG